MLKVIVVPFTIKQNKMTKFKITVITLLFAGFVFSSCNRHIAQHKEEKQTYYTCPMHKDLFETQPGKCRICGMVLVVWDMDNMSHKNSGGSNSGSSGSGGHSGHNH
jgi:uncharacterized membrane protein YgcG